MAMTKKEQQKKVFELIQRSDEIYKKEYQRPTRGFPFPFVDGPMFRAWMGEINTLNERYYHDHPLYADIKSTYEKRNNETHAFEYMVSHLNALYADNDYWAEEKTDSPHREDAVLKETGKTGIFISHRTCDKEVADMLVDFLVNLGIPRGVFFCSSLPGNDVQVKISDEVKQSIKDSGLNIAILSDAYYESAYCLNEAGILWYLDTPVIPIALPEIDHTKMIGFLDGNYKIRRLDNDDDLAFIYEEAKRISGATSSSATIYVRDSGKLKNRYREYTEQRATSQPLNSVTVQEDEISLSIETFDIEPSASKNADQVTFRVVINNSSNRTLSVFQKFLRFYKGEKEFHSVEVSRYEVHRREDALDSILVLEPVNAIITLQPGHAESVGIINAAAGLADADKVVFSCIADKRQYELILKE